MVTVEDVCTWSAAVSEWSVTGQLLGVWLVSGFSPWSSAGQAFLLHTYLVQMASLGCCACFELYVSVCTVYCNQNLNHSAIHLKWPPAAD